MLYYLHHLAGYVGPFRHFEYLTFRAGGAFFTAFLLALVAIMLGQQVLLFIAGFVFILELASSFIQCFVYRHFGGRRFFLMAPLHHHYEKMGIPDAKIVVRFWIFAVLCAAIALATLKLR